MKRKREIMKNVIMKRKEEKIEKRNRQNIKE